MKKWLQQVIAAFCIIAIACSAGNTVALAESNNGKFVLLNIAGYDEAGQETVQEDNVFYVKGNVLYAPVQTFEKYTMYNYDPENNAFVRIGQDYKHANSKIVLNFENKTADVFYSSSQKETINIEFYQFNDTYFLPLAAFAAYLKASVIYKDSETVSIVSSGISLSDAMYNYSPYQSCLSYSDLENDIFAGNSALFQTACVLGYFGETVFSFKVSNLLGNYGDYQKYLDILESAVTNNEPYEQIFNNDDLLTEVLDSAGELGNKIYDKAHTVYKLSSNTVVTLFEEFKTSNLPDANEAFNNFFPDEQAEIDQIKSFSECVDAVDLFLDVTEYYQKFYAMNQDNRNAIGLFSPVQEYDIRALALNEIAELYNNSVVEGAGKQIGGEIVSELLKDSAGTGAEKFMTGANKVKLATSIVNSVFKAAGFDLSDNSGYDVMLAGQLKSFVLNSTDDNLKTQENCQNMRLKQILGILIDIQSYKMGNKFAAKYDSAGIYDKRIEDANKRLALFYLAKESEKFDSVEGVKVIIEQNKKELSKFSLDKLDEIDMEAAKNYLIINNGFSQTVVNAAVELIYNFPKYGMQPGDTSIGIELIDLDRDEIPEILYWSYVGASGIPGLNHVYSYDGQKYEQCEIDEKIGSKFASSPILPKRDKSGVLRFLSDLHGDEVLERDIPGNASFWYYYACGVAEFRFVDKKLTSTDFVDYEVLSDRVTDYQYTQEEHEQAWDEYKAELKKFNDTYKLDNDYKYIVVGGIVPGYVDISSLSMAEQLSFYHKAVSKNAAKFIVDQYIANETKHIYLPDYF